MNYCYKGYVNEFLCLTKEEWLFEMNRKFNLICHEAPSELQYNAWDDCYEKLRVNLEKYKNRNLYLIFEYLLPHEGGRRPDLIILLDIKNILVVEFKEKDKLYYADIDQVRAYSRDLKNYHKESHNKNIKSILVLTKTNGKIKEHDDVTIISPDMIDKVIDRIEVENSYLDVDKWRNSSYEPLPTLVEAARMIYNKEPLPHIRRANSAGIPKAVSILKERANESINNGERTLALVTGVPGAGKTLLGIQFVYECFERDEKNKAIFLSGNGPLVQVLQHALKSDVFIKPLRNFIKYYGIDKKEIPKENVIVFDEAQRAWDLNQINTKYKINKSEPDIIIDIADSIKDWAMVVGLIGEGQEIHTGEEEGIIQWREAILKSNNKWKVICPEKISNIFKGIANVDIVNELDLNTSLRSHLAEDVTTWTDKLLQGEIEEVRQLTEKIIKNGFIIYITRDLEKAKRYCKMRYEKNLDKRYGLIASSKSMILPRYGVDNSFNATKNVKIGQWFNDDINSNLSCCRLDKVVTEFGCQGLELDMPIICWEADMVWDGIKWKKFEQYKSKAKDPNKLRVNSYRVLLTRGRDGFIIYVPRNVSLDSIYKLLKEVGVIEI